MEEDSSLNDELQCSKTDVVQESLQLNQNPEGLQQENEVKHSKCSPDRLQDQLQEVGQHQGLLWAEQSQDLGLMEDVNRDQVLPRNQDRARHHGSDQHQHLTTAPANREVVAEPGGSVPALVITQAEESLRPASGAEVEPDLTPVQSAEEPQRPPESGPSSSTDGGDMTCSDLLSLKSDSLSLASEPTASKMSEDDDSRSVAASSVMSLFHRVQLDPLEKDWLKSSAVGNMAAQRQLLSQDSSLVLKKTALHWAAKQGRQESVDLMLRFGADVNVRSGYTALHLAAIHGRQHIVHALINIYTLKTFTLIKQTKVEMKRDDRLRLLRVRLADAKTNIRDYHGKTAVHYWSGCTDLFNKPDCQSGGRFHRGRQTQRHVLPSLPLSRSRSQGQFNLEFGMLPQSRDVLDLQL